MNTSNLKYVMTRQGVTRRKYVEATSGSATTTKMDPDVAVTRASQLLRMTERGVYMLSNGEN
jgi:hypothetical protein